jgi:membrane protein
MSISLSKLIELEQRLVWDNDYSQSEAWIRIPVAIARTLVYVYREFSSGELNLRAMSLVYTSILSLVPLLAFSFSVLKGFGVQNQIEPLLLEYFWALGPEKSEEITIRIVEFVNNIDVRVLGAVGLALLVYTIITLMQKIEAAFNHAWHVKAHRSFAERFATFISVLTVGPLLVFAALAITGSVLNNSVMQAVTNYEPFGTVAAESARLTPYFLVISAFTFLYILIPNTRVKFLTALVGGVVAGLLWESAGYIFAYFVASATKYQAVYATFGTAMFFMIWLYVSWLILLVGASISYYVQNPNIVIARARKWRFSYATFEGVALTVLVRIVNGYYAKEASLTTDSLSAAQQVPPEMIDKVIAVLENAKVISRNAATPAAYMLRVPPEETSVASVVQALRQYQIVGSRRVELASDPVMESLLTKIDLGIAQALGDTSLKALAQNGPTSSE